MDSACDIAFSVINDTDSRQLDSPSFNSSIRSGSITPFNNGAVATAMSDIIIRHEHPDITINASHHDHPAARPAHGSVCNSSSSANLETLSCSTSANLNESGTDSSSSTANGIGALVRLGERSWTLAELNAPPPDSTQVLSRRKALATRRAEAEAHHHRDVWVKEPHGGPYRKVRLGLEERLGQARSTGAATRTFSERKWHEQQRSCVLDVGERIRRVVRSAAPCLYEACSRRRLRSGGKETSYLGCVECLSGFRVCEGRGERLPASAVCLPVQWTLTSQQPYPGQCRYNIYKLSEGGLLVYT